MLVRQLREGWLGLDVDFGPHSRGCTAMHNCIVVNTCCMHSWVTLASAVHAEIAQGGGREGGGQRGWHSRGMLRGLRGRIETVKKKKKEKGQANVEETSSKLVPALASEQRFFLLYPQGGKMQQKQLYSRPISECMCVPVCVCGAPQIQETDTGNLLLPSPVLPPSSARCSLTCVDWLGESEGWGFVS